MTNNTLIINNPVFFSRVNFSNISGTQICLVTVCLRLQSCNIFMPLEYKAAFLLAPVLGSISILKGRILFPGNSTTNSKELDISPKPNYEWKAEIGMVIDTSMGQFLAHPIQKYVNKKVLMVILLINTPKGPKLAIIRSRRTELTYETVRTVKCPSNLSETVFLRKNY